MKKSLIFILVLLVLILAGGYFFYISKKQSKSISKEEYYGIFDVNYDITYDGLLAEGFIEDPELYGIFLKQVNDTLQIHYQVDHGFKIITQKIAVIETSSFNLDLVQQISDNNKADIITNPCINDVGTYKFFAKGFDNGLLFECLYGKGMLWFESDKPVFIVIHEFPIEAKGGMFKDHPYNKARREDAILPSDDLVDEVIE